MCKGESALKMQFFHAAHHSYTIHDIDNGHWLHGSDFVKKRLVETLAYVQRIHPEVPAQLIQVSNS